ncbi:cytochrome P450 CYP82D47-like isoform X2 [Rhodamnia argentea]|uniref:Cytochrome P450 CYP82D47-like isoform X2 n=1 Tax=Rhodamnia argentea TaxID=178133 RepID=A0ABM3H2F3_9MYRT|nr:cytochrome P450 CYP82D47-like isoform X2 [Rhodamnia argentea]
MDSMLQDLSHLSGIIRAIFFLSILVLFKSRSSSKLKTPPEAAGSWPLIGHLLVLAKSKLPHKTLASMADEYGPIFTIRLGMFPALVVSSSKMAKECFTKNDLALSTRPRLLAPKILAYDYAMFAFAAYGSYWREVRKMVTMELLTNRRVESLLNPILASEADVAIRELHELCIENKDDSVDLKQWFAKLTLNVIIKIVAGKRYPGTDKEEEQRCHEALRDFFHFLGMFLAADALPFLRWLDLGGHVKAMKRTAEELEKILGGWLEERKSNSKDSGETNGERDFMDVMLSVLNDEEIGGYDSDTIIKSTCLAMIAGGSDTTMVTLTWAISLLLNNLPILKKAQEELDARIGNRRRVKAADIASLTYLQAIVKETLRLQPPVSLSPPRLFTEDCTIGEYHVPKGTRLIVNISKIHIDPGTWSDPLEFRPERFLSSHKDVDVTDSNFELLPFGGGRRICPGISFGLRTVHFLLARFLHAFEISTSGDSPVDMSESFGLTTIKATPLEVILMPRLPDELYQSR